MKLKILAVGKVKEGWIREGIKKYLKRMPKLKILEINDSSKEKEFSNIKLLVNKDEKIIVFSEEGEQMSSLDFAAFIEQSLSISFVFVIGGPEGISENVKRMALKTISLSKMTFTHEMARLFLVEQIYRAKNIMQNGKYHK